MSIDRQNPTRTTPSRVLGTRALAVISCALALLAAQPVIATTSRGVTSQTVKITSLDAAPFTGKTADIASDATRKSRSVAQPMFLSSARRLHILATVEILHRLLIVELRPTERQMAAALLFAPQYLCILDQPTLQPQHPAPATPAGLSREHAFAITRCLLAPPLA